MTEEEKDIFFMRKALELARKASAEGEVPVGALIVKENEIIGSGYNMRERLGLATAHAEVRAIEEACKYIGSWRLNECVLYVTMEPCPMCTGAIINSRIKRVVYGVKDAAAGCCGSLIDLNRYPFSHSFSVTARVCEVESTELLQEFFRNRRAR